MAKTESTTIIKKIAATTADVVAVPTAAAPPRTWLAPLTADGGDQKGKHHGFDKT